MIITVIIIPNVTDDIAIPTTIPTPNSVMQQANSITTYCNSHVDYCGANQSVLIRESVDSLCRVAPTRPLSLKKCNSSELSNAAAISPFRNITWPTSVSIPDKTLKGGKIHRYNDMRDFAKTRFLQHLLLLLLLQ